jgi:ribosomal protein S12 methylthiotransferase
MKVGLLSLGCPKNLVDGEVMIGLARDAGHEIVGDASSADVVVVNTCAFIDRAKEESIDAVLEMAELKRRGGLQTLVVTGCLAERYGEKLRREIPDIDVVLGTGEVPALVGAIRDHHAPTATPVRLFRNKRQIVGSTVADPGPSAERRPTYLYDASTPRILTTPRHYAYVKIAEGCDYRCAFCIIPTLRGAYRSREADSIVQEAESLAARGIRELLLISQDSTFFGVDRQERGALGRLLRRLNDIPGLVWIRLLYLYPTTITDDVLDAMAACEKVCRYIDLPLQHASNAVLKRMRRPGTRASYDTLIARIRRKVPDVTLRTTFIVGFPGETEEDFACLIAFVRAVEFDHVGVFTYSHEEGTRAYAFPDDVPAAVKEQRRETLMAVQREIVENRRRARIGTVVTVMVDGLSPESSLVATGRLEGQAPEIDSQVIFSDCDPSGLEPGTVIAARIIDAQGYDLVATPLPPQG